MDEIANHLREAAKFGALAVDAREAGDEVAAEAYYREAFRLAYQAADRMPAFDQGAARLDVLRAAAIFALECGEVDGARRILTEALEADADLSAFEWSQICNIEAWPDPWLVAAVRQNPPDEKALDVLADRFWRRLFGHCQLLTLNREKASDLAQEAWCRVLRARHRLRPGGNFNAYLMTVATNIWRDSHRLARRAGPMAEHRLESLDSPLNSADGEIIVLGEVLQDLAALNAREQSVAALDIDRALEHLTPRLRDVLVSRYLAGESCAEIGRRFRRTEQTISSWVREAIREIKVRLEVQEDGVSRNCP